MKPKINDIEIDVSNNWSNMGITPYVRVWRGYSINAHVISHDYFRVSTASMIRVFRAAMLLWAISDYVRKGVWASLERKQ